jgi:hypothetical protein
MSDGWWRERRGRERQAGETGRSMSCAWMILLSGGFSHAGPFKSKCQSAQKFRNLSCSCVNEMTCPDDALEVPTNSGSLHIDFDLFADLEGGNINVRAKDHLRET